MLFVRKKNFDGEADVVTQREKGSAGINRVSTERNDFIITVPGQQVHQNCRREDCLPSNIKRAKKILTSETTSNRRFLTRQAELCFSFKTDCFFCGTKVEFGEQRKRLEKAFRVTIIETKDTILKLCSERGDEWSDTIRARLLNAHDLPAAEAVYHQTSSVNFHIKRKLPKGFEADEQPAVKIGKLVVPMMKKNARPFLKLRSAAIRLYLTLFLQVKKHWSLVLTLSGISGTLRNLQQRHLIYSHRISPPPTAAAARFHRLRVDLQVQQ